VTLIASLACDDYDLHALQDAVTRVFPTPPSKRKAASKSRRKKNSAQSSRTGNRQRGRSHKPHQSDSNPDDNFSDEGDDDNGDALIDESDELDISTPNSLADFESWKFLTYGKYVNLPVGSLEEAERMAEKKQKWAIDRILSFLVKLSRSVKVRHTLPPHYMSSMTSIILTSCHVLYAHIYIYEIIF
jgi:hypothetical protein